MIYLFYNAQRVGQVPEKEEKAFLVSEDFLFWKKNCVEIQVQDQTIIRPTATSFYNGVEYTHVVEFVEIEKNILHRIPGTLPEPSKELKLVRRKFVTRAG